MLSNMNNVGQKPKKMVIWMHKVFFLPIKGKAGNRDWLTNRRYEVSLSIATYISQFLKEKNF